MSENVLFLGGYFKLAVTRTRASIVSENYLSGEALTLLQLRIHL